MDSNTSNYFINQKGQTLLVVVIALTIALAVGISVSLRTLSSSSRTSQTDTSSRALAAAEAGAERFLILPKGELDGALESNGSGGSCPTNTTREKNSNGEWGCRIDFPAQGDDPIATQSIVTVDPYEASNSTFIEADLDAGDIVEFDIDGYAGNSLRLCWNGESHLYYYSYDNAGNYLKGGIRCEGCSLTSETNGFDAPDVSIVEPDYTRCRNISVNVAANPTDRVGFRVRAMEGDATVAIKPTTGNLPTQGYIITSTGSLVNNASQVTVSRTVIVTKLNPYPAGVFDYTIFSNTGVLQ